MGEQFEKRENDPPPKYLEPPPFALHNSELINSTLCYSIPSTPVILYIVPSIPRQNG
jgi:hypothetical protein